MKSDLYQSTRFFTLTYLVTYVSWFIGAYFSYQEGSETLSTVFLLPGLIAPFGIALYMILSSGSKAMRQTFIDRLSNLRLIKPVSFLLTLLIIPAALVLSALVSITLGGESSQLQFSEGFSFSIGMVPSLLVLVLAACFEELGWRSYAMDSLRVNRSYFKATLIFSILWAGWHVPLFFINGSYQNLIARQDFLYAVNFFAAIVPMAFIISWVCQLNRGSILAAALFHFFSNMTQEALQVTQSTKCIETAILMVIALVIVLCNKSVFFNKSSNEATA